MWYFDAYTCYAVHVCVHVCTHDMCIVILCMCLYTLIYEHIIHAVPLARTHGVTYEHLNALVRWRLALLSCVVSLKFYCMW